MCFISLPCTATAAVQQPGHTTPVCKKPSGATLSTVKHSSPSYHPSCLANDRRRKKRTGPQEGTHSSCLCNGACNHAIEPAPPDIGIANHNSMPSRPPNRYTTPLSRVSHPIEETHCIGNSKLLVKQQLYSFDSTVISQRLEEGGGSALNNSVAAVTNGNIVQRTLSVCQQESGSGLLIVAVGTVEWLLREPDNVLQGDNPHHAEQSVSSQTHADVGVSHNLNDGGNYSSFNALVEPSLLLGEVELQEPEEPDDDDDEPEAGDTVLCTFIS